MRLVIDASVAVKWILGDQHGEADVDRASALLGAIARRTLSVIEPVHWVAGVAGVVTRLKPNRAVAAIALLTHARFSTIAKWCWLGSPRHGDRRCAPKADGRRVTRCASNGHTLVTHHDLCVLDGSNLLAL